MIGMMKLLSNSNKTSWTAGVAYGCVALMLSAPTWAIKSSSGETLYYRYLNEQGVRVINHTLPPEFAQGGYELVTASGTIVKVVEAALSGEDAKLLEEKRLRDTELAIWDKELRRRYSSVRDIEAAKERKLAEVDGNIAILNSNIRNLRKQIANQHARAANTERSGHKVSKAVINTLSALEKEMTNTRSKIEQRRVLREAIIEKFAKDADRFRVIRPGS